MNNKVKAVLITVAAAAWCGTVAIGLQVLSKFVTPEQTLKRRTHSLQSSKI